MLLPLELISPHNNNYYCSKIFLFIYDVLLYMMCTCEGKVTQHLKVLLLCMHAYAWMFLVLRHETEGSFLSIIHGYSFTTLRPSYGGVINQVEGRTVGQHCDWLWCMSPGPGSGWVKRPFHRGILQGRLLRNARNPGIIHGVGGGGVNKRPATTCCGSMKTVWTGCTFQ